MKKRIPTFIAFLIVCVAVMSQEKSKLTLNARMMLQTSQQKTARAADTAEKSIEVVLKIDEANADATIAQLKAADITLHARLGQLVSATIPVNALPMVQRLPGVIRIDSHTMRPKLMSDVTRQEMRSNLIDGTQGTVGDHAYTGKGVTVCVMDMGFDFQHPAFLDVQGRTRIKAVYMPFAKDGEGVNIGDMTLPGAVYDSPEQIASLTTDIETQYHGTHTGCIAAGTRSPQGFGGIAPDADIVLCCTEDPARLEMEDNMPIDMLLSTSGIFHSLAFISHYAQQHQQPLVVNISQGINNGSHNGQGTMQEALETLCQQGIPVVLSVGNEGEDPNYLKKTFESDNDTLRTMMSSDFSRMDGYTYDDSPLVMRVSLVHQDGNDDDDGDDDDDNDDSYGNDAFDDSDDDNGGSNGEPSWTTVWQSPLLDATCGELLNVKSSDVEDLAKGFSGELRIGVVNEEGGTHLACYYSGNLDEKYQLELTVGSKQGTVLHLFDVSVSSFDRDGYAEGERGMSMSDWATAPHVISVGAYCANLNNRTLRKEPVLDEKNTLGDIAEFSSYGMGFNGIQCPMVCAPGVNIVSAVSHYTLLHEEDPGEVDDDVEIEEMGEPREDMMWNGFHYSGEEGTSQSAPAVAGTIALWLEADPTLTVDDVRDILVQCCHTDEFTEAAPEKFGHGKVDAKKGLELVLERKAAGIADVYDEDQMPRKGVFMLDGRRVHGIPTHGLYVIDGKKVLVK